MFRSSSTSRLMLSRRIPGVSMQQWAPISASYSTIASPSAAALRQQDTLTTTTTRNPASFRSMIPWRRAPGGVVMQHRRGYSSTAATTRKRINNNMTPNTQQNNQERFVLPHQFSPKKYTLRLVPNMKDFTFEGVVDIEVQCREETDNITLNVADIKVHKAQFKSKSGTTYDASDISINEKDERVVFKFSETLKEDGVLHIEYAGEINDKMKGFYRSSYTTKGEKRYMATTQFEANDARRAFPCWDEPNRKAAFDVELVVDKNLDTLSNMPVKSTEDYEGGKKLVRFDTSPIMSTYLVAFCIGEYEYIETTVQMKDRTIPLRVYTTPGKTEQGRFALEVGSKVLPNLEKFFGVPVPLAKMDMIAIPDFAAGAMENLGLVTYRDTALLFDEKNSSLNTKQWVALVVAHELSHQWFGNLVTMTYFDYLYLNESSATLFEYLMVDELFPEWKILNQFIQLDVGNGLILDSMESSHSIEIFLKRAEEVDEIFDAISYSKGCAVLSMLANYISVDTFRKALTNYLTEFAYGNAESDDLWRHISEVHNSDIKEMMYGWTKQVGYPVVQVSRVEGDPSTIRVRQQRFLQKGPTDDDTLWKIPLSYITDKDSTPKFHVLDKEEDTIKVPEGAKFVKFNAGQFGFYRIQYSEDLLPSIVKAIENDEIEAIDRLGILQDVYALAKAGYIDAKNALTIFSAFRTEDDYIVVKALATNMVSFYNVIKRDDELEPLYNEFARNIFERLGNKLGWNSVEGESSLDTLKRTIVLGALKKFEHPETMRSGMEKFRSVVLENKKDTVSPDLLSLVYGIGLSQGGRAEYEALLKVLRETELNEERVRVLGSLGHAKDEDILDEILKKDFILDEVKAQDLMYPVSSVSANKNQGREKIWNWFTSHYATIKNRVDNGFLFGRILKLATKEFDTLEQKREVEKFLSDKDLPQLKRSIAQALEAIELNAVTRERVRKSVTPEVLKEMIAEQK